MYLATISCFLIFCVLPVLVAIPCMEFISLIYKMCRPNFHTVGYVKENQIRVWEKTKGLEEENKNAGKNTNSS